MFSVDTNVLVYAYEDADLVKRQIAGAILLAGADAGMVLTAQVLGEFINVVRRKRPSEMAHAVGIVTGWTRLYTVSPTDVDSLLNAAEMSLRHKLQLWDAIIWQSARAAGCSFLLSEDLQDQLTIDGVTLINPFREANAGTLAEILQPIGGA